MTFRALLDRTVTIVPRVVTGTDGRGNEVWGDGTPIPNVRAAREIEGSSGEDTGDTRDQQDFRWLYFLEPKSIDGVTVELGGRDRIRDGSDVFEVDGPPDFVRRRRGGRVHHVEAIAYYLEG